MSIGNALGVVSLVLLLVYAFGSHLPVNAVTANLRGLCLLLIVPVSLIAGWLGSRLWWVISVGMIAMAIFYFVALSRHS